MPVSGLRREMSSRSRAAYRREAGAMRHSVAQQPAASRSRRLFQVGQGEAGAEPDPNPFPGGDRSGQQDQRCHPGALVMR